MAKSDKFDQAVNRARNGKQEGEGGELATGGESTGLAQIGSEGVKSLVRSASASGLAARVKAGEIEAAPQLLALEAGNEITARVLLEGTTEIEDMNARPGEPRTKMATNWHLQLLDPESYEPGPKVSILGAAQLDRQLRHLVGKVAVIARGGDVRTGKGRVMTEYFCGEDKRAPAADRR